MAGPAGLSAQGRAADGGVAAPGAAYRPALAQLASLFFRRGFITVLNGILIPHLNAVFDLTCV